MRHSGKHQPMEAIRKKAKEEMKKEIEEVKKDMEKEMKKKEKH